MSGLNKITLRDIEHDITELVTTDNSFNFFLDNGFIDNYFE
jgi:hypothetical protein